MTTNYQERADAINAMWDTFMTALDVQCADARLAMRQAEMILESSGLEDRARADSTFRAAQAAYEALMQKAVLQ